MSQGEPMKTAVSVAVLLLLLCVDADAQRRQGGNSPFTEFHKKAALANGASAPMLLAQDTDGKLVDLRDYLGQWVFIEFGSYT